MRSILFLFIALFLSSFSVQAQKGQNSLSVGPSVGLPLNFHTGYKTGFGAGLRGYFGVTPKGSVLGNINFLSFPGQYSGINTVTLTSVKVGYKTSFNSPRLFLYGDGGLVIKSGKQAQGNTDFGLGAGLGYSIPAGTKNSIDIVPSFNIVFQEVLNRTWLDLHFAYHFQL